MSEAMHPLATHHLPSFITAPGETDVLFTSAIIFFVILVLMIGSFYFWLHSLPERLAHGTGALQFQLVAVLALLALFTHNTAFWIAALLLALVPIPDFWTPLSNMAESLARMAGRGPDPAHGDVSSTPGADVTAASPPHLPDEATGPFTEQNVPSTEGHKP